MNLPFPRPAGPRIFRAGGSCTRALRRYASADSRPAFAPLPRAELNEGGFDKFTQAYKYFGINRGEHDGKKGVWYREWAPGCQAIALVGTFNNWEPQPSHWAIRNEFGVFQLFIPDNADGTPAIPHMSKVKARVQFHNGHWADRIPAYIRRVGRLR